MKTLTKISINAGCSQSAFSNILNGRRRPSWSLAKRLASATHTTPELWLDGTSDQIREALSDISGYFPENGGRCEGQMTASIDD